MKAIVVSGDTSPHESGTKRQGALACKVKLLGAAGDVLMCFVCAPGRPFHDASAHPSVSCLTRFRLTSVGFRLAGNVSSGETGMFGKLSRGFHFWQTNRLS